jgi:hypothetical protein
MNRVHVFLLPRLQILRLPGRSRIDLAGSPNLSYNKFLLKTIFFVIFSFLSFATAALLLTNILPILIGSC